MGKQHNPSGELGSKTTSGESDQKVFDEYKKGQMQMPGKQIRIKLPAMRMLDTGEPADVQKLKTYVHELFGHLGYDTILDACEMIDGADILKALCLLKVVILIMNLMLRARTLSGVPRDITVWEAHYGQRPNVGELLLGPFGCLAYLILTKETRQRKGMSTY